MTHFEDIADWYDLLFPARPPQLDFLAAAREPQAPASWLDVACGAGQHLQGLADRHCDVHGFDLEPAMIERLRARRPDLAARVAVGDMRETDRVSRELRGADAGLPGTAYCIGNSLALLPTRADVGHTLASIARSLSPGGGLVLQIVNFDRVLDQGDGSFPVIEREGPRGACRFEREYRSAAAVAEGARLTFLTRLETPEGVEERSRELLALRRAELSDQLAAGGFRGLRWFGDFTGAPWRPNAPATIVRAAKGDGT